MKVKTSKPVRPLTPLETALVVIVAVVIFGAFIMLISSIGAFIMRLSSTGSNSHAQPTISISGASGGKLTTTDPSYKLRYSVTFDEPTTVKLFINNKEQSSRLPSATNGDTETYTEDLAWDNLKYGDNSIKITANKVYGGDDSTLTTQDVILTLSATQKPVISVNKATGDDPLQITNVTSDTYDVTIVTESSASKGSGAMGVTVNGTNATPGAVRGYFNYKATLKEGQNSLTIIAKNNIGETTKTLVITHPSAQESATQQKLSDALFEADVTCQEYAESYFRIKNINVHYDQSSIKRQNGDGTLLIKANIADSQGLFHPEKPLGTMECTTDSTGMTIRSFEAY